MFPTTSGVYKRLGQFDYGQPSCTTDHIKTCINEYYKWVYIGEVKEGTDDTPHGIGIKVLSTGDIHEGYWKDGKLHGRGRTIYRDGEYYIGEFKEGNRHGEGTYYYEHGDRYKGGWKNNGYYGQGTLYYWDGDKHTGFWDDYKGQGEINYKDGTKYKGQWDGDYYRNIKIHGSGILYSVDGQVLNQGNRETFKYKEKE